MGRGEAGVAFSPDLFLIAVGSDGIRMTGEVSNIRVALVRVHAHPATPSWSAQASTTAGHGQLKLRLASSLSWAWGGGLSVELVSGARAGGIESWICEDTLELSLKPKPKQP